MTDGTLHSRVRTLYLYLFSLVGLILVTIGSVGFLNMGLKAYVFTQADSVDRYYREMPPRPRAIEETRRLLDAESLTAEETARIRRHLADVEDWEEGLQRIDHVKARRHRNAAENLALMLIGLPLYLYHWRTIKLESSNATGEA
jgi:hypothetical protein